MDVLVVENEPLVREMVTEWLEDAGLDVAAAANAEVAMTVVSASSNTPPLPVLVTDIGLGPESMDGIALAAEMRRRWPGLGVVTMIDNQPNFERCGPPSPQDRHLIKPFAPTALVDAVRELAVPATASPK